MLRNIRNSALTLCLLLLITCLRIDFAYGKQKYNTNTDFLLHEGGSGPYTNGANKNSVNTQASTATLQQNAQQNNGNRDYVAEFPTLKPLNTGNQLNGGINNNQNTGKRDYVASSTQPTTRKPTSTAAWSTQSSGSKRDYVAPQFPTLKPIQNPTVTPKPSSTTTLNTQSAGGKRDYVAPQRPTSKPNQGSTQPASGKVKDLIHYFDNNGGQNSPQKMPSYSYILSGTTNKNQQGTTTPMVTPTTVKPSSSSTKPFSYSSIVSGSKTPNSQTTFTTVRPSTRIPSSRPTQKPSTPVLPSSIVNGNRNTNTNSNSPSDAELQTLSEELLRKDVNNAAKYITVNYQEKTTSQSKEDKAPNPLLTISPEAWNIPTIQKFLPLLDNYERDTLINEYVTPQERNEENAFMDAIMSTSVIRHLMNFLKDKGYVTPDPRQQRDYLKQLWFSLYSRGKGKISSSGFEHVFVSEARNQEVLGLHNWIYFAKEEAANRMNYLGYLKYLQLGDKGTLMKAHFNHLGADKPVNSLFIGTSPELEMALYTLCFVTRADKDCSLKLSNNDVSIATHTFRYRSKNLIGSAYPQIPSNWN